MAMLQGDYKRRIQSATKSAATSAGWANDPVPIPGDGQLHEVCPAGGDFMTLSISATSTGTNMVFKDANGTIQELFTGLTVARDYKLHFYCPWPLYVSSDVSCIAVVSPPAKGATFD